jgi:hypothetical protein
MYLHTIFMLLSWPVLIVVAYYLIRFLLNIYEKKQGKMQKE